MYLLVFVSYAESTVGQIRKNDEGLLMGRKKGRENAFSGLEVNNIYQFAVTNSM